MDWEDHGGVAVLRLRGRLAGEAALEVAEAAAPLLRRGSARLVADLSGLSFLDSSGLGMLVSLRRRAQRRGGDLRLAAVPGSVAFLLQLARLHRVFACHESVAGAVASYAADSG